MYGHENLVPQASRSPEEAREMGRKGGVKSGESRRRKRDSKEQMLTLLKCVPQLDDRAVDNLKRLGLKGKGRNKDQYAIETIAYGALLQKAMKGDVGAHKLIQEMIGEDAQTRRLQMQMDHEKELAQIMSAEEREDDGFVDALNDSMSEVFVGGIDEPRNTEDSFE